MKKLSILTVGLFLLGIHTGKAQCVGDVHLDTTAIPAISNATTTIVTSHPGELILISYDGWTGPGLGPVTVDGNPATHIITAQPGSYSGSAEVYAYTALSTGTHTILCGELGYSAPYYCNFAAAFYTTRYASVLSPSNVTATFETIADSTGGYITDTIVTTAPNSMIYGNIMINTGERSSYPISWTGATRLDTAHTGGGIDYSDGFANAAIPGTYTITAGNLAPNFGYGGLAMILVAITPPSGIPILTTSSTPDTGYCSGTATVIAAGGPPFTYVWTGGQTTSTATGLCPGTYNCTVTDSGGCSDTAHVTIVGRCPMYSPAICYVTTDANSQHNVVVWQKADVDSNSVDSFFVYRKAANNSYAKIGQVSIHNFTEFIDTTSYPDVTSYFYKLSIRDTCHDTAMSAYHQSVLLQSSLGIGHKVNLNWNFYQGVRVNYYRILRDDSGLGHWHVLDSVPSVINAYTDTAAPLNPGLQYRLSLNWNVSCSPYIPPHMLAHAAGRDAVVLPVLDESYSNISVAHPTGVQQLGLLSSSVNVYPNPTNNMLNITVNGIQAQADFYLTDMLGQVVFSDKQKSVGEGFKEEINITSLPSGVYFLSIESNGQRLVKKVVKL